MVILRKYFFTRRGEKRRHSTAMASIFNDVY